MDDKLRIRPVGPDLWVDFEQLFESRGGPKNCWCMIWREYAHSVGSDDKGDLKEGMRERIRSGTPVGLLAYLDDEPVAWCSVAPRQTYKASLDGGAAVDSGNSWSLTCLFVKRAQRGKGVSDRLIEAAIDYARSEGATTIEAYPVEPDSPSYRFCGFLNQFARHEFKEVGRVGSRRHIVCRKLSPLSAKITNVFPSVG
jgi:GNAT superfamily N-acetyltransferase